MVRTTWVCPHCHKEFESPDGADEFDHSGLTGFFVMMVLFLTSSMTVLRLIGKISIEWVWISAPVWASCLLGLSVLAGVFTMAWLERCNRKKPDPEPDWSEQP